MRSKLLNYLINELNQTDGRASVKERIYSLYKTLYACNRQSGIIHQEKADSINAIANYLMDDFNSKYSNPDCSECGSKVTAYVGSCTNYGKCKRPVPIGG